MEPAEQAPAPACKCTKMAQEEWKSCQKKIEMIWAPEKTKPHSKPEQMTWMEGPHATTPNALFSQEISQEVDEFMGNMRLGRAN
jgi:hypothetical protein